MPRHRNKRAKRTSPGVIARHIEEANVQPLFKGRIGTRIDAKIERAMDVMEMSIRDEQRGVL